MLKNKDLYPKCIFGKHRKDNNIVLNCYMCSKRKKWYQHKSTDTHLSNLWYFKQNFSDAEGLNFFCKLCESWIPKSHFKRHATNIHKLSYLQKMTYEIDMFFNNCIQLYENIYACHLCKYTTDQRNLILNHTDMQDHQINLKKYMPIETEVVLSFALNKKFIMNSIFPYQSSQLKCWLCNCYFDGHDPAEEHISSETHKNHLSKMKISLGNDWSSESNSTTDNVSMICNDIDNQTKALQPTDTFSTENKFLQYFENFIGLHKDHLYCNLCQEEFSTENLASEHLKKDNHCLLKTELHKNCKIEISKRFPPELYERFISNYIFPKKKTAVNCIICRSKAMSYNSVEEHINGKRHLSSCKRKVLHPLLVKKNNIFVQMENAFINEVENEGENDVEDTTEDILTDQAGEEFDNFHKYFENYISKRDNDYYCYLCNGTFSSSTLVLIHINKPIHHHQMNIEMKTNQVVEIGKIPHSSNVIESFVKNGIFRYDNGLLKCFICKCNLDNCEQAVSHIESKEHLETNQLTVSPIDFSKFTIKKKNEHQVENFILNSNQNDQDPLEHQFVMFFQNFIFCREFDQFCNLCEKSFESPSSALTHINSDSNHEDHLQKLKENKKFKKRKFPFTPNFYEVLIKNNIFPSDVDKFKCFACDCEISNYNKHIISPSHKVNLLRTAQINTNRSITNGNKIIPNMQVVLTESNKDFAKYFENFIEKRGKIYYCHLCKIKLPLSSEVLTHINDPEHNNLVGEERIDSTKDKRVQSNFYISELFVRNGVFQLKSGELKCFICDQILMSFIAAATHVNAKKHAGNRELLFHVISVVIEQPDNPPGNSDKKCEDIEPPKAVELKKSEPILFSQESLAKVSLPTTTKKKANQCHICKKRFKFSEEYFEHLTSHFWRHFRDDVEDLLTLVNLDSEIEISFDINEGSNKANQLDEEKNKSGFLKTQTVPKSKYIRKKFEKDRKIGASHKIKPGKKITMKHMDIDLNKNSVMFNIYEMDEELRYSIQLSFNRICIISKEEIYCMICRRSILFSLQNVYEHFRSIEHSYFLVQMVDDHSKFEAFPNEFSDLYLAREMLEDKSDHHVLCYACNSAKPVAIPNNISSLKIHINSENHSHKRIELSRSLQDLVNSCNLRLERNWFNIQKYWCVMCSKQFVFEKLFLRHLRSKSHNKKCDKLRESQKFIYDYCPACALLFFGYTRTYIYHSECKFHKFHLNKNVNFISRLPTTAEKLLIQANEISMKKLTKLEQEKNEMERNQELLLDNLKNTINEYIDAEIYLFGSRVSGLGSTDSDLDIFLDCDDSYHKGSILDDVSFLLNEVEHSLKQSKDIWTINKTIPHCRIPIIKVTHKLTNIDCDISFTNGLAVENTKLIKKYIEAYPMCKRIILFLKDWLNMCDLGGEEGISSYAITWMVIYYLQTKFILPNVTQLMKFKEKSCVIDIWETGVSNDIDVSVMSKNFSFLDLLRGFFTMAANFDYRHNIICPLLGRFVKKVDFIRPRNLKHLPIEMNSYRNHFNRKDLSRKEFRADSVLGIQDPYDLSNNLTKAVTKTTLYKFRTYCKLSAETLTG